MWHISQKQYISGRNTIEEMCLNVRMVYNGEYKEQNISDHDGSYLYVYLLNKLSSNEITLQKYNVTKVNALK